MRRTVAVIAIAAALAVGLPAVGPSPVAAAEGYDEAGTTVYSLDPAKGVLRVTVTLKVTNRTPDKDEPYPCIKYTEDWLPIPYPSTCHNTTRYYMTTTRAVVENEAKSIRATAGGKQLPLSVGDPGDSYRVVTITFPDLYFGKTATVKVSYTVKGGAPRSASSMRTLRAYASFCAIANGADKGTVSVRVPKGFDVSTTGAKVKAKTVGKERVFTSGTIRDTASWFACFTGTNAAAYRVEKLDAPDGRAIRLQSWPEDRTWAKGVRADLASGLPALEALIGTAMDGTANLNVRESSTGNEYAGFFDVATNTITVGEDFRQPALVEHELAHAWFNGSAFKDVWLSEGFAEWAGRSVSEDQGACTRPEAVEGSVALATWKYLGARPTAAERQAVLDQYDAACWVVTSVARAAGNGRMTAAVTSLLQRRDPYAAVPTEKRASRIATWKDWLDAVDELALGPAGAPESLASDLLLAYGAAGDGDRETLASRVAARRAYHLLVATVDGWVVPPAVRKPLATWDFGAAEAAITAASGTWEATGQTDAVLAGVDARHGPAAEAWEHATTVEDLQAAADLAERQLVAARDVADARALVDEPLDIVERVGLFGTQLPSVDAAIPAVRAGDGDAAAGLTAGVRATIAGLRATGEQRIAVGAGSSLIVAALLLALVTWRVRVGSRRRAAARLAAVPVATSAAHGWSAAPHSAAPPAASPAGSRHAASEADPWSPNPLDDSPTQVWDLPIVVSDPDPDLGSLVRRAPPAGDDAGAPGAPGGGVPSEG